jgi:ubiquinone/menaquinone biosynthesis C-methylase UbiE
MDHSSFKSKWSKIKAGDLEYADEQSLFVDVDCEPVTQRQLTLYYLFLFIKENLKNAKDVLEIGCGRGTMSLYLAKYLNLNVSLLDNSPEAIEIVKEEFSKHGKEAKFYVQDATKTDIADNSFDAIISIGLAEHLDNVKALFKEEFRLLRPGGTIISLNVPKKISIQSLNSIMKFFKKYFGHHKDSIKNDYYRNSLKAKDYKRIAESVGFQDVKIVHVNPFPTFTPIRMSTDKIITKVNKFILKIRKLFQGYPYKTNYLISKNHFLVGYKK